MEKETSPQGEKTTQKTLGRTGVRCHMEQGCFLGGGVTKLSEKWTESAERKAGLLSGQEKDERVILKCCEQDFTTLLI